MTNEFQLPDDELEVALNAENKDRLFVRGWLGEHAIRFQKGNGDLVVVPFDVFTPAGDGTPRDYALPGLADCGQTIKLGDYEAAVDAVLHELSVGPQRAAPKPPPIVCPQDRCIPFPEDLDDIRAQQRSYKAISDEAVALARDAARYRYIRDVLAQFHSPHMDGTGGYRFRTPSGRGRSLDEVIDALIERDYGSSGRQPT